MYLSNKGSVAVHCLVFISEYGERMRVTSELLATSTGCNAVTIRGIVSALKKNGILRVKDGAGGAVLNCPPEQITLWRVYQAVEPDGLEKLIGVHGAPSPYCPVGRSIHAVLEAAYAPVRADLRASLEKITLRGILADYHSRQPASAPAQTE